VMKKKLEKYCRGMEGVEGKLVVNILAGLNKVAYPSFDTNTHRNTFSLADVSMADTIIESATRALRNIRPAKLYEELDFELLEYLLNQAGINFAESNQTKRVADIIDYFYSNPKLPMVRDEVIKSAILDGVKSLRIGIRKGSRIYFKKVYECRKPDQCTPPSVEEGEQPHSIELDDVVLPWRTALQEQLEHLKETKEERVAGGIKRVWHAFYINGELIPVAEALESFDLDTLRLSPVVRVVEVIQEGVDVKLDKYEVSVAPDEEVEIGIVLDRVGMFVGEVFLETSDGDLSRSKVSIDDKNPTATVEWKIKAPGEPGSYTYDVKAKSASGELLREVRLALIVRPRGREANKGIPPKGTKVSLIELEVDALNFKPLRVIDVKFGPSSEVEEASLELQASVGDRSPRISVMLSNVALDDVKSIFPAIVQMYGIAIGSMRYRLRIRPRTGDYMEAPEFGEEEARDLERYMKYYVYEEG
ncbi:MAG TPA: DUF499 domain-containing protein, partial [Thermoprotei archaeon]|nr:DUF499 domain-containing protein [Thermoprotei archaeon]